MAENQGETAVRGMGFRLSHSPVFWALSGTWSWWRAPPLRWSGGGGGELGSWVLGLAPVLKPTLLPVSLSWLQLGEGTGA